VRGSHDHTYVVCSRHVSCVQIARKMESSYLDLRCTWECKLRLKRIIACHLILQEPYTNRALLQMRSTKLRSLLLIIACHAILRLDLKPITNRTQSRTQYMNRVLNETCSISHRSSCALVSGQSQTQQTSHELNGCYTNSMRNASSIDAHFPILCLDLRSDTISTRQPQTQRVSHELNKKCSINQGSSCHLAPWSQISHELNDTVTN